MAKKIQKEEKIESTAIKTETTKVKSAPKVETVAKTSKKAAGVAIETDKKAEPVNDKVIDKAEKSVSQESKPVVAGEAKNNLKKNESALKENKKIKNSEPVEELVETISKNNTGNELKSIKSDKIQETMINKEIENKKNVTLKQETSNVTTDNTTAVPTVRYSDEDLEEFAKIIKESKDEAMDELRMLKERLEDLTSSDVAEESMIYSMHMAEQGSEAQEKEKTYAQIQRIQEYLKKLEDAMDRIKNKTYGICRVCGCLIAKARLMAVPITTLSASYKIHQRCPEDGNDRIEAIKK